MTLIEVVAGLALLATVLTLVFAARGHVSRQQVRAERRLEAVAAADAMLATWWRDPLTFPTSGSGSVPAHPALSWHTAIVPNPAADALGSKTVRLEVASNTNEVAGGPLVVAVEVAVPLEAPPDPNRRTSPGLLNLYPKP